MTGKKRILFVDDEQFVLQGLQRLLRDMRGSWDMVFVDSGAKGLEELTARPFDVVVTDMRMPGMNGAEFLNRVKERHPETVRLVLSGHADADMILDLEGAAHQFLAKPCDPEVLRSVIASTTALSGRLDSEPVRRVLGGIAHLPVLPAVYQEILSLLQAPSTTLDDLARVIRRDPGMTANLLKLVNSAYFGLRHRISDPGEAVAYLGIDTLKSLALAHGIFQQIRGFPPGINGPALWGHSVDVAAASRQIARAEGLDRTVQNDAFTGGLLHDIGLMILASSFHGEYERIAALMEAEGLDLTAAESRVLGAHHGQVGGYLLSLWGVPDPVVEAVTRHHEPREGGPVDPALLVFAAEGLLGGGGDGPLFRRNPAVDEDSLIRILGPDRFRSWQGALAGLG